MKSNRSYSSIRIRHLRLLSSKVSGKHSTSCFLKETVWLVRVQEVPPPEIVMSIQ
jgi:hypothetical protein